jgi:hypothetical protein
MRIAALGILLAALAAPAARGADGPAKAPAPPAAEAPVVVELTKALLDDLAIVLERRGRPADARRLDPAWFAGLTLTADRFDAVYDEVARCQHARFELLALAGRRKDLETWLARLDSLRLPPAERTKSERDLAEVKAAEARLEPVSDVERSNRELIQGRPLLPLLDLRVPLSRRKPQAATSAPGWPFVDPKATPAQEQPAGARKPAADPAPPKPREPKVALTEEVVAEYLRLRQRAKEAGRTRPDAAWFESKVLDERGYPEVDEEIRFQLHVLELTDAWKLRDDELAKTMEEIEPLLLSASGQAYVDVSTHYFAVYEEMKARNARHAALTATTKVGEANLRLVARVRSDFKKLYPPRPEGSK